MNRPHYPRMMNGSHRSPMPYNPQWRPYNGPPHRFPWNTPRFGVPDMRSQNKEEQWCETCDRGFPTTELLEKHKSQHQKCNIDGCQFIAHPKVITKHIQMQHSTGLYKKIANLTNPEEIQKWRDERRKKYPTKSNIEKKVAECKEKIERGEKMNMKPNYRIDRGHSAGQGSGIKRKYSFDKKDQNQKMARKKFNNNSSVLAKPLPPAKKMHKIIPSAPTTLEKNKLRPFTGILNIDMDHNTEESESEQVEISDGLIEDDYEELPAVTTETITQGPVLCGALTSLMCDYGTSDEEREEKENEACNTLSVTPTQNPISLPKCDSNKIEGTVKIELENNGSDDEGPEEVKILKTNVEHETAQVVVQTKEKPIKKSTIPHKSIEEVNYKVTRRIPSTLLQKLLHNEIKHERNIVLQCIRYIKKKNYFDKTN